MKTSIIKFLAFILLVSTSLSAQEKDNKAIYFKGSKFTYPLIEKWITEYNKENLQSQIKFGTKQTSGKEVLDIIAYQVADSDLISNQTVSYVGRYALVPVSNKRNPIIAKIGKGGLSKKVLKKLFFDETDEYGDEQESKSKFVATVYSRENQAPTTITLAKYFDAKPTDLKGKKILGDDIYLLNAIKRDSTGVTFNSLNYAYDIESRKLRTDIALLPLNLKSQQKEILNTLDIDNTIALLEKNSVENIPVGYFGFVLSKEQRENHQVTDFVKWVLAKGQQFNHQFGFLNLDETTLTAQKAQIDDKFLTSIK
jgi:ABC-type phosphate transport system substrate-binding protein